MVLRIGVLTVLLILFPADCVRGGEPALAGGKGDLQPRLEWDLHRVDFNDIQRLDVASSSGADEIEAVSTIAEAVDTLRYNLERIDVGGRLDYGWDHIATQAKSIKWDIAATAAVAASIGLSEWDWGSRSFRFESEGWFGRSTEFLGMDKLGHAYSGYLLTEYFTQRVTHSTNDRAGAALTGAVLGMGLQTYVEVLDGFSDNGFSHEDFVADGVGVGFSVLRSQIPGLAEKLDFRMEYLPSGNDGRFAPFHDYSGQKYLLALKLSGFEAFEDTPLRFVELHAGYFARGFTEAEREQGDDMRREPYVAVAVNLQALLNETPQRYTLPVMITRKALEYVQPPYTYAATSQD